MFTLSQIDEAIKNKELLIIKDLFTDTPPWDDFIAHLSHQFNNDELAPLDEDEPHNNTDETIINGVNIREHFYLMISQADDSRFFPKLPPVRDAMNSLMATQYLGAFTLINFVAGERKVNPHYDPRHSFYWQTHGTSTWEVYDPSKLHEPIYTKEVSRGDMLFVPHGVWHSVVATEPRSAISFMYEL
jgi:hypothetical protein